MVSGMVPLLDSRVSVHAFPVGDPHAEFGGGGGAGGEGSLDSLQVRGGWVLRSDLTTFLLATFTYVFLGVASGGPYPVGGQVMPGRPGALPVRTLFWRALRSYLGVLVGTLRCGVEWKSLDVKTGEVLMRLDVC